MPCTDPRDVTSLDQAFDLTSLTIQSWELMLIWKAEELGLLELSHHAHRAARDDSIPTVAVYRVVRDGIPRSKDITMTRARHVGINFEGKRRGGGRFRAKVSWASRYVIATVHAI